MKSSTVFNDRLLGLVVRFTTIRLLDVAILMMVDATAPHRVTSRFLAESFGVSLYTVANSIARLKKFDLLGPDRQLTAYGQTRLDEVLRDPEAPRQPPAKRPAGRR
jgi:hypothetical protein